jgi:hypothetical protein
MGLTVLIFSIFNFLLTLAMVVVTVLLTERTRVLNDMNVRTIQLERYMNDILSMLTGPGADPTVGEYRSIDGKYSGRSLEELIQNIASGEGFKYDPNDPESLRKFFEQIIEQEENDDDDDSDSSWKEST